MKIIFYINKKESIKTYVKFIYDGTLESAEHMQWLVEQSKLHPHTSLLYNVKTKRLTSMPVNNILSIGIGDYFVYDYYKHFLYSSRSMNEHIVELDSPRANRKYEIREMNNLDNFDLKSDLGQFARLLIL